jgi:hypothetical protein
VLVAVPAAALLAVVPAAAGAVVSFVGSCRVRVWWWVLVKLKTFVKVGEEER